MIILDNQTKADIDIDLFEKIVDIKKNLELIIVDNSTMHNINLEQRGINKTTDVLSFPIENIPHFPLGSIVINSDLAKIRAVEFGHSVKDEISLMFIHGFLHITGYDHERDNGEMREEEKKIIHKFNLPKSLIVRMEN